MNTLMQFDWMKIPYSLLTLFIVVNYGFLLNAFIQKIGARVGRRRGIPIWQNYADVIKNYGLRSSITHGVMFYMGPVFRLSGGVGLLLFVPSIYGSEMFANLSFAGDEVTTRARSKDFGTPDEWLAGATQHHGSWWPDWAKWVAAQAPEYRKALDAMRAKDGRRFFLKNTAPNLAGAELQELVRAAIESNGGRITTSQNQGPKDDGRFRQITVTVQFFASTPALQKILHALEARPPYLSVESMTLRPLNAFRGFKPGPGQEPELNVQLDVAAYAFAEPEKK